MLPNLGQAYSLRFIGATLAQQSLVELPNKKASRMKNKLKPNSLNLVFSNELENKNTLYYNLDTVVCWNNTKAESNFKKHGVTFEEAATVFYAGRTLELEDLRHNEQRFIIIGFSVTKRILTVVYAYKFEDEVRIISARRATKNEVKKYEERI